MSEGKHRQIHLQVPRQHHPVHRNNCLINMYQHFHYLGIYLKQHNVFHCDIANNLVPFGYAIDTVLGCIS